MIDPGRIVVTGAAGFIGRHLVEALRKKGRNPIQVDLTFGIDLCEGQSLQGIGEFDALVHLAGRLFVPDSFAGSGDFFRTNILGTINALELCKKFNAKFITLSSYVYGPPEYLPVDEKHPVKMWNPYAASKIIAEQLAQAYSTNFGLQSIVLRVFNVFGDGQKEPFLIPKIVNGLKQGRLVLQDPEPRRDYVYVLDLIDAIERCLDCEGENYRVYNIGAGVSYSVSEIVIMARTALGSSSPVEYTGRIRKTDIMNVVADIAKIRRELGWEPRFDMRAGLAHAFGEKD